MRKLKLPGREKDKPRLDEKDIKLVKKLGVSELKKQAGEIIEAKLVQQPDNDGVQTPNAGNPIYKAMHACQCDSRKSLSRSHRIPAGRPLKEKEVEAVVNLLTRWIIREYNFFMEEREEQQKNLDEFA